MEFSELFSNPVTIGAVALLIVQALKTTNEDGSKALLSKVPTGYTPLVVLAVVCVLYGVSFAVGEIVWAEAVKGSLIAWLGSMGAYSGSKSLKHQYVGE